MRRRAALVSLTIVLTVALIGALMPEMAATETRPNQTNLGVSWAFWLGTDRHGRAIATRLVIGLSNGVWPALGACTVAGVLGLISGTARGWLGGFANTVLGFLTTVLATIPRYVLVLVVLTIWGDSALWLALAAGLAWTPSVTEAVSARVERLRHSENILASRIHGVPPWRLLLVHTVWFGCRKTVARQLLGLFSAFLVLEASLAYIGGLGIREPTPSLGNLLAMQWGR
ncbi:MAG: ABC-type dipeptide/oligopeptide/nickel transport system permease subunit, partial [bacterium]